MDETKEQNLYGEKGREEAGDGDEINEAEEGFMKGYDEESNPSECANCHTILEDEFVEEDFEGSTYRFCSEECARKFEIKKEHI
ncbi:hypothetical protein HOA59_01430 [archaeon]|jgi:hypothetical protein|nr:hypothetical protein [archaeon]MBT6824077.1 hypothetical protein [archaeon]MBT7107078.1 hypothetical protein [archaeon]MBT7297690.1 hypothetical protein [archaeon]